MKVKLQHVAGYSPVDHKGPAIIRWATIDSGPAFSSVKQARGAARTAALALRCLGEGAPRIDAVSDDGTLRVRVL